MSQANSLPPPRWTPDEAPDLLRQGEPFMLGREENIQLPLRYFPLWWRMLMRINPKWMYQRGVRSALALYIKEQAEELELHRVLELHDMIATLTPNNSMPDQNGYCTVVIDDDVVHVTIVGRWTASTTTRAGMEDRHRQKIPTILIERLRQDSVWHKLDKDHRRWTPTLCEALITRFLQKQRMTTELQKKTTIEHEHPNGHWRAESKGDEILFRYWVPVEG